MTLTGNYRLFVAVLIGIAIGFALIKADLVRRKSVLDALRLRNGRTIEAMLFFLGAGILFFFAARAAGWSAVHVRPGYLWSSLLGGLLCGAGVMLSGVTPTTTLAALGSGRLQMIWVLLGMALAYPAVEQTSEFLSRLIGRWDLAMGRPPVPAEFFQTDNPALYLVLVLAGLIALVHFTIGASSRE